MFETEGFRNSSGSHMDSDSQELVIPAHLSLVQGREAKYKNPEIIPPNGMLLKACRRYQWRR